ncbi:DNA cytosine methyltransferase [Homoserinibacter sp. GY 40078]|uniref:DNA cytosine methyltransferase n=1 Tax=Homoserinibacter sp. GY 40078 TaxID=2603275 RepID=UPI0011CA8B1E|nr:DNA cytosine methyltransferase [Homoserinibacter sp. GY 40078]TXK19772.1 DNA cytosine methyltransferase [Homoserinibacter sp. GY 40078]
MPPSTTPHPLRSSNRPGFESGPSAVRLVDLFAGCGGLSLGFAQAAHDAGRRLDVRLAVDFEGLATEVYSANFPGAAAVATQPVEEFFDGPLGSTATLAETRTRTSVGMVDVLVGGPPCQGHSNLNNHTRRIDGKNALYLRMVRATEILKPRLLMIENVPSVVRDRHDGQSVVDRADRHLRSIGYQVAQEVIPLAELGVAQARRRHIMIATASGEPDPRSVIEHATRDAEEHDLEWAIGDLVRTPEGSLLDQRPRPTPVNLARMQYLLDNDLYDLPNEHRPDCHKGDHTYLSMYGRLRWDRPAQTITSGYGSIGQGRYMHPDQPRALTAHEAARIQGFPDYFDFSACPSRSALATMIGNAVPPQLGKAIATAYLALASTMEEPEQSGTAQSA